MCTTEGFALDHWKYKSHGQNYKHEPSWTEELLEPPSRHQVEVPSPTFELIPRVWRAVSIIALYHSCLFVPTEHVYGEHVSRVRNYQVILSLIDAFRATSLRGMGITSPCAQATAQKTAYRQHTPIAALTILCDPHTDMPHDLVNEIIKHRHVHPSSQPSKMNGFLGQFGRFIFHILINVKSDFLRDTHDNLSPSCGGSHFRYYSLVWQLSCLDRSTERAQ